MSFHPEKPHILPPLPPEIDLRTPELFDVCTDARAAVGELQGYASSLPNPMILLSPAIIKESVASSQIENIHTTVEAVLQQTLFPDPERREPDREVLRYRDAIWAGFQEMRDLPISSRLIEIIHRKLMKGKAPGYRKTQNYIRKSISGEIIYTPPVASSLPQLIGDLESFIYSSERMDPLIKAALVHYQFEAIHPFLDGNGRTGRILMVLHLVQQGLLRYPILYISGFINENRDAYYKLLEGVSRVGDWASFARFLVAGIGKQALETQNTLFGIMSLYDKLKEHIRKDLKNIPGELADHLFASPITTPSNVAEYLKKHYSTATRYLNQLKDSGILEDVHHGRYHLYANKPLMELINQ